VENKEKHKILPLYAVARRLHVPQKWLRAEAEADRIPHLKAGKTILLNPHVVEKLLVERASKRGTQ
jgi:hypothetical protein